MHLSDVYRINEVKHKQVFLLGLSPAEELHKPTVIETVYLWDSHGR